MCSISVPLKRPIFHDYVICTTRWQSSLDMSKIRTMEKSAGEKDGEKGRNE